MEFGTLFWKSRIAYESAREQNGQEDVQEVDEVATKAAAGQVAAKTKTLKTSPKSLPRSSARKHAKPTLLAGNPQIAKGYGDGPVEAYIAAMPGWKSEVGRRLDALIVGTVPGVRKAVKWNSPLYGVEGQGCSSASTSSPNM